MAKDYVEIINDGSGDRYVRDAEAQAAIEQITEHAVLSVAGKTGNVTLNSSDVGLGNVTNDAQVKASEKGAASGVATLNSSKKVLIEQIPISVSGNVLIIG